MNTKYFPVDHDYYDMILHEMSEKDEAVIHYFGEDITLLEARGKIAGIITDEHNEDYVDMVKAGKVRIDRIIVVNGKPGPAYDEYDSYALACLDCMGGMD